MHLIRKYFQKNLFLHQADGFHFFLLSELHFTFLGEGGGIQK